MPGFLGQRGGWAGEIAHVLGHWSDRSAYEDFMATEHDRLAVAQRGSFSDIEVLLFEHVADIGDPLHEAHGAGLVRVAHSEVAPERVEHFLDVQHTIWNPGMSRTPGMLSGAFARRGPAEFLVLTQWASRAAHQHYQDAIFPALRDAARPADDLQSITGHLIDLEPSWHVVAP